MKLIDIIDKRDLNGYFDYNIDMFADFIKKGNEVTLIYKEEPITISQAELDRVKKPGIKLFGFNNEKELKYFLKNFDPDDTFVNTFYEQHIVFSNQIKDLLGQPRTKNLDIFFDKSKLKDDTKAILQIGEIPSENNFSLEFPVFVKPNTGTSSIGCAKINNFSELTTHLKNIDKSIQKLKNDGISVQSLIVEEFIEGELFSMNCLIDSRGLPHFSTHHKQRDNLGGPDIHLIGGEISNEAHQEINQKQYEEFLANTIQKYGIKNSFISHQFKKTPNGDFKTIEINGRIGGFKIETYKFSFDFNLLDLLIDKNPQIKTQGSSSFIRFYPKEEQDFKGYNQDFLNKIRNLKSYHRGYVFPKKLGEKVGTPKNGYFYLGVLILQHKDRKTFEEEFQRVRDNYYSLLNN